MLRQVLQLTLQRALTPLLARTRRLASSAGSGSGSNKDHADKPANQNADDDVSNFVNIPIIDYDDPDYLPLPEYPLRPNEPLEVRKQRLIYQSRKRGMLENDLILSTFAARYLHDMDAELTAQYDHLINGVTNDWDIYYWATNIKPTPAEHDNEIMRMLKEHVANAQREQRLHQPALY